MKRYFICFTLSLTIIIGINLSAPAENVFDIQRIRIVPNPAYELLGGEEILEITFIIHAEGWIPGVGWALRYYDRNKQWFSTCSTAYFSPKQNNTNLINDDYFKGETVFVALFPLRGPETAYIIIAIGDGLTHNVQLFPYTDLLQSFRIPIKDIDREIIRSDHLILEETAENIK